MSYVDAKLKIGTTKFNCQIVDHVFTVGGDKFNINSGRLLTEITKMAFSGLGGLKTIHGDTKQQTFKIQLDTVTARKVRRTFITQKARLGEKFNTGVEKVLAQS